MKKLFIFFASLLFALGFSYAQEQTGAPVNTYGLSKIDGTYRTLSASATVLFSPTEEMQINHKYIVKADSLVSVSVGKKQNYTVTFLPNQEKQPASIRLDKDFTYGIAKTRGIGVSTDGFLFFSDTMYPSYFGGQPGDNVMYYLTTKIKNFLYFNIADRNNDGKYAKPTPLYARQDSKIGYEKDGDLLIIAYENLYIKESETEEQQISWNYQINLETGDISLQTKGFYSDASKNYPMRNFAYGLVGTKQNEQVWLAGFNPLRRQESKSEFVCVSLGRDSLQDGALYSYIVPEKCKAIDNPVVNWKINVTDNDLSLAGTTWTGAPRALFLVSENETLTTEEQPQDGKEFTGYELGLGIIYLHSKTKYDAKDSLWAGKGLLAENQNGKWMGLRYVIENLKSVTDYWIHAYLYDNTCVDGPVYGTAVKKKITTSMPAPSVTGMFLSDVTEESMKLTLPALPEGETYMVAISEKTADGAKNILKNGVTYQAGEKVGNGTIKHINIGAGTYVFNGLKNGTSYYVWVWRSMGSGENIKYSAGCAELADKTVFKIPVEINFGRDELYQHPLAWKLEMGQDAESSSPIGWQVSMYKESELSSGMSAKAPEVGAYILCNQFYVDPRLENVTYPKTISVSAITPMMSQSNEGELGVTFNLLFYIKDASSRQPVEKAYRLKDGDSLVISWAANRESTVWQRLAVVDKKESFDAEGFIAYTISGFNPMGVFCFKLEFYHAATEASDPMGVAIQSVEVTQDLPCKTPSSITVAKENITISSALIEWKDGNSEGSWAEKFLIRYRPAGATEWLQDSTIDTKIELTGLKYSTNYEIGVQAVCDAEKGKSLERTGGFTTLIALKIPYSYDARVQNDLPEGSRNMRGIPGKNLVEIDPVKDAPAIGWEIGIDASISNNTLVDNLEANANTWLVLPVLLPDSVARVNLRLTLGAFGIGEDRGVAQEALKSHDSLWVFVSMTGDFKTDRQTVGVVNIDDLHYKIVNDEMLYDTVEMEFSVDQGKGYYVAFYIPGKEASADYFYTNLNMFALGSIKMTYGAIEYPAVTDIQADELSSKGFRLSWQGQADSYRILLKEAAAAEYETISENTTSHTFSNLKEDTRYMYRIYGIYNGEAGRISEEFNIRTLSETKIDTVAMPEFTPGAGKVAEGTVVKITCATEGANIYYTTDGNTPTLQSSRYLFGVSIPQTMVVKAIAVKEGLINSPIAEAEYIVNVANEAPELAGVSLYPNPTSGSFKVVVPVSARVEIFTANGTPVKSFMMSAGTEDVVLDNSGIYFIRFTAENGSVAVKRLVVR